MKSYYISTKTGWILTKPLNELDAELKLALYSSWFSGLEKREVSE
jgi:hypothetical protein